MKHQNTGAELPMNHQSTKRGIAASDGREVAVVEAVEEVRWRQIWPPLYKPLTVFCNSLTFLFFCYLHHACELTDRFNLNVLNDCQAHLDSKVITRPTDCAVDLRGTMTIPHTCSRC